MVRSRYILYIDIHRNNLYVNDFDYGAVNTKRHGNMLEGGVSSTWIDGTSTGRRLEPKPR